MEFGLKNSINTFFKVFHFNKIGLEQYGINWEKIELRIKTRTKKQVRSHGQKFLNKL
jgi:hypothetical protein